MFVLRSWFTETVRYLTRPLVAALVALFIVANGGGWTELAIRAVVFLLIDLGARQVLRRRSRT